MIILITFKNTELVIILMYTMVQSSLGTLGSKYSNPYFLGFKHLGSGEEASFIFNGLEHKGFFFTDHKSSAIIK